MAKALFLHMLSYEKFCDSELFKKQLFMNGEKLCEALVWEHLTCLALILSQRCT